ncbi:MAG: hypothetical protein R2710_02065 [Acidimicrobiales bacterium]
MSSSPTSERTGYLPVNWALPGGPFSRKLLIPITASSVWKGGDELAFDRHALLDRHVQSVHDRPLAVGDGSGSVGIGAGKSDGCVENLVVGVDGGHESDGERLQQRRPCDPSSSAPFDFVTPDQPSETLVPPAPGMMPSRTSGWPNLAPSPHTRKSAAMDSSQPPRGRTR